MTKRATIDDLYRIKGKAEVVDGEIRHLPLMEAAPGWASGAILFSLHTYVEDKDIGRATGGSHAYRVSLPNRESFSPHVGLYTGPPMGMKFLEGAPRFAVEVRNSDERGAAEEDLMAAKRADYFAAGTLVVWDVDLLRDAVVRVYRARESDTPTCYHLGDEAEAEPAVPGWRMPVDDLFD